MKRPLLFDWIARHKIATLVTTAIAALLGVAWLLRGSAGSSERLATGVAALRSAETCLERSQLAEADRHCEHAIEILGVLATNSGNIRARFEHAAALETMALIQSGSGQPDQADVLYRKAIPLWARLLADNQADSTVRFSLARCLARHASLLSDAGRWEEAEKTLGARRCRLSHSCRQGRCRRARRPRAGVDQEAARAVVPEHRALASRA